MTDHCETDDYDFSTDLLRMDLGRVHHWLSTDAPWALGRTRATVEAAAHNSLNFAALTAEGVQVGYARVVTDGATFAWLCDVYVDPGHRGRGLSIRLSQAVVAQLRPLLLKRVLLATPDAHELYAQVGFAPVPHPEELMILEGPTG